MTGAPGWTREVSGPMVTVLDRRTWSDHDHLCRLHACMPCPALGRSSC